MATIAEASLTPSERRVVERLVERLRDEFGGDLHAVWLYGSRARGETPGVDSDIDLMVVSTRDHREDHLSALRLAAEAADAEGANPARFSVKLYSPARVAERRAINSFFLQEIDRDKVVLFGDP